MKMDGASDPWQKYLLPGDRAAQLKSTNIDTVKKKRKKKPNQ